MADRFDQSSYLIRRKMLKIFGGTFWIYGEDGEAGPTLFHIKQKAFKLREDIRVYSDEALQDEVLTITARQIIDWSAAYDVVDTATGESVGVLRRRGARSILRDEWEILDSGERHIATLREDSMALALVRRFVTNLIPQSFSIEMDGQEIGEFKQNFNPFIWKLTLDFTADPSEQLDRRLGVAAGILVAAIEGRQSGS
jgi:uncharacterized protein YxjI